MLANPMEMEAKRNIYTIAEAVYKARASKDSDAESAAVLQFIDHILTGKEKEAADLNQTGKRVFPRPYVWQKFSPSCPTCNGIAMENLKKWRNDFLPKTEVLIGELWGFKAGQVFTDPLQEKATIKGFSQDRNTVIVEQQGKELRLTKTEFSTYKPYIQPKPEPAAEPNPQPQHEKAKPTPQPESKTPKKEKAKEQQGQRQPQDQKEPA